MKEIIVGDNEAGKRLDKFLGQYLSEAGKGFIYKMLRKKNIVLNGHKADGSEKLAKGDSIRLWFSDETYLKLVNPAARQSETEGGVDAAEYERAYSELKGIEILFENKDIMIVNKPAGILTQKAAAGDISLNEWLIGYLLYKNAIIAKDLAFFKPSVCNRLDRNTSGLVICSKSLTGARTAASLLKDRSLKKYYRTVVSGIITEPLEIRGVLSKDEKNNIVKVKNIQSKDPAANIDTAIVPLAVNKADKLTYIEVELRTGKTHQIRAHLASIGHPLIGDSKYGDRELNKAFRDRYGLRYQLLHAYRMEFPGADEAAQEMEDERSVWDMVIECPLPPLAKKIIEDLF
ncbi:RluA family pseudouridine synthase [Butyrivibrio sp. MC2013]|uniref:RluA family pseudouridine synthase n=1 Tax=Butyrivibrio sp. MC2013 TaxID=1280686 RepID=UPI0003FCB57B|nr:RluA family pseudouridine synthase [Butyrivibrio sp. MC2013]